MSIITSKTTEPQGANVIAFPHPLRHRTQPLPTKRDRTLFVHGEFTEDGKSRYCAKCDLFWGVHFDHEVHFGASARP